MRVLSTGAILLALMVTGCDGRYQVRTYADLQVIVRALELNHPGPPREEALSESIRYVSEDGLDVWGNPFLFFIKGDHWVVFSTGADGAMDLDNPTGYFQLEPADIRGDYDRDIVFRDGKNITYAGK